MSSTNADTARNPDAFPTFDLLYIFDDDEDPTQVTIFSEIEAELDTHWITMDVEHAIDLDESC